MMSVRGRLSYLLGKGEDVELCSKSESDGIRYGNPEC
jgi:hypothetical protein